MDAVGANSHLVSDVEDGLMSVFRGSNAISYVNDFP